MLARTTDRDRQAEYLRVIEDFWLAMSDPSEMFAEQAWFTKLREGWGEIAAVLPESETSDTVFVDATGGDSEALVRGALDFDPSTDDGGFSWSTAWQLLNGLGRLGRVGAGMASTLRGAERAASAYRPGPIVHRLLFESGFSADEVRTSGVELRLAFVGLESGELRFMRQDGVITDRDGRPTSDESFDLPLGVWASCSIPGVFRPVKLGDEMYVDGGVRENVPVEMAVSGLGVTRPYVIVASPPGVPPGFQAKDLPGIITRSFAIMQDETVRDEIAWARHAGAVVVNPLINVHGPLEVDHGLLRINRDYGWMRAAEEMTGVEPGTTTALVEARLRLHHVITAPDPFPGPATRKSVMRTARKELRALVAETDPDLLPEGFEGWPDETWDAR